jgi:creatinine amidohydrolase
LIRRLAEMSWREAEAARDAGALVLLPIGSTEAHGPHLPLATDVILSETLAGRAAEVFAERGQPSVIAPSLAYAVTEYAAAFAGTISISAATAAALVADVCLGLQQQGFPNVCLINSHLEPAHVETLRRACALVEERGGRRVAFPDQLEKRWGRTLGDEYRRGECHAGSYETSLVMAARPELVQEAQRARLAPVRINLARAMRSGVKDFVEAGAAQAYFGDPASATTEEGEELYRRLVEMVVTVVGETWPG